MHIARRHSQLTANALRAWAARDGLAADDAQCKTSGWNDGVTVLAEVADLAKGLLAGQVHCALAPRTGGALKAALALDVLEAVHAGVRSVAIHPVMLWLLVLMYRVHISRPTRRQLVAIQLFHTLFVSHKAAHCDKDTGKSK